MTRLLIALMLAFGLGTFVTVPTSAQADVDCDEIATDADAQAILAAFPGDPFDLDRDGDGNACDAGVGGGSVTAENFIGAQSTEAPAAPTTGDDTDNDDGSNGGTGTETDNGDGATTDNSGTALPDTGSGSMQTTGSSLPVLALLLGSLLSVMAFGATFRTRRQ